MSSAGARRRAGLATAALTALVLAALAIGGCGSSSDTSGSTGGGTTDGGASRETQAGASAAPQPVQRAAAAKGREAGEPKGAAGACGRAKGAVPTLTIDPDVPSPRCMVVAPGQRLRVLNETGGAGGQGATIVVDFAGFHAAVPPSGSVILDAKLGTYLLPGSHYLRVGGGPGPAEIRLQG